MKKNILSSCAIAALVLAASCNRTELPFTANRIVIDDGIPILSEKPITFGSARIGALTRAVTEVDATSLSASGFKVLGIANAYDEDTDETVSTHYINNVLMTNQGGDSYYNAGDIYYWPAGQTLDFYAVNPAKTIAYADGNATVAHTLDAARGFDLVVACSRDNGATDEKVSLAFHHALSQVSVKLKSSDANADYKVRSVVFNAPKSGIYTIGEDSYGSSWTSLAAAADSTVFSGNLTTVNSTSAVQVGDTFIAFPGSSKVTVSWETYVGGQLIGSYTESAVIVLEKGKKNSLTLILPNASAQNIAFLMAVDAWEDADEVDVQMGPSATIAVSADAGETVTLPTMTLAPGTALTIDWGDGNSESYEYEVAKTTVLTTNTVTPSHTYSEAINNRTFVFVKGKVSMTVPAAVAETIDISDEAAVEVEQEPEVYTFAGLQIAPGPLYYNGTSYEIKNDWNVTSYKSVYGKVEGSTYFNFIEMGQLFEKADFGKQDGNIDNILNPFNGWRLPTLAEWQAIATTDPSVRPGSTVNGTPNAHWAFITITGVSHADSNTPRGLLVFPDGKSITGKALVGFDKCYTTDYNEETDERTVTSYITRDITATELAEYLSQGCIFLPTTGYYYYNSWDDVAGLAEYSGNDCVAGVYASSEMDGIDIDFAFCFHFLNNDYIDNIYILEGSIAGEENWADDGDYYNYYPVRLVRE